MSEYQVFCKTCLKSMHINHDGYCDVCIIKQKNERIAEMEEQNFRLYRDKRRAFDKLGWAMEFNKEYEKLLERDDG